MTDPFSIVALLILACIIVLAIERVGSWFDHRRDIEQPLGKERVGK